MRVAFWWMGAVLGWLGVMIVLAAILGVGWAVLLAPKCPPEEHLCGEGVGIAAAAGCWAGVVGMVVSAVGFTVRGLAAPKVPLSNEVTS